MQLELDPLGNDFDPVYWRYYLWAVRYFIQTHHIAQKEAIDAAKKEGSQDPPPTFDASPLASIISEAWFKKVMEKLEVSSFFVPREQ